MTGRPADHRIIPLPAYPEGVGDMPKPRYRYPWSELQVGQSFLAPHRTASNINSSMANQARRRGHQYRAETVQIEGVTCARVWRTA